MSTYRYGTCHFENMRAALNYYGGLGFTPSKEQIERVKYKIDNGEIAIGKPEVKPNEKVLLNTSEGRYFIEVQN